MGFEDTAIETARASGYAPEDVANFDFAATCEMAGVAPAHLPSDFVFERLRERVAAQLQADLEDAARQALQDLLAEQAAGDPVMEAVIVKDLAVSPLAAGLSVRIRQARDTLAAKVVEPS